MRTIRLTLAVPVVLVLLAAASLAVPFVLFPKTGELTSPDGRFAVRNVEQHGSASDIVVTSAQSLWLVEIATGRSQKLRNYLGVAAVAWSGNDFVLVTEYVGKKTSRAWLFPVDGQHTAIMLDKPLLTHLVPSNSARHSGRTSTFLWRRQKWNAMRCFFACGDTARTPATVSTCNVSMRYAMNRSAAAPIAQAGSDRRVTLALLPFLPSASRLSPRARDIRCRVHCLP